MSVGEQRGEYKTDVDKHLSYYSKLDTNSLFSELESSQNGLSSLEAEQRLKTCGHNILEEQKRSVVIWEFLKHFKNPLILILLIAAIVSASLGQTIDSIIIGVMILVSVLLDFFQEHSAQKAAEKLKETVKTRVHVLRDGQEIEINIEFVVPGDIILLSAGDKVPADARILNAKDFFVNQSALTGESFPCAKSTDVTLDETGMSNIVFLGTNIVSGSATAVAIKTGKSTEFGKISKKLVAPEPETEFERGISNFSYLILKVTIFLVLFIFLFNAISKKDVLESLLFAIAVAVGVTPEFLPIVMSVTMAKSSISMAKKGVIVKKLSSIPNFGSMDVLCTDKTGTLTEDKIRLVKYVDIKGKDSNNVLLYSYVNSYYQTGIHNPLDNAVLEFKKLNISDYEKIDEIPFDFFRKRMSVVVEQQSNKKRMIIVKGAPDEIIKYCKTYTGSGRIFAMSKKSSEEIVKKYHDLSSQGYRVLAVGIRSLNDKESMKKKTFDKSYESDLQFLGFIAFLDPAKSDVKEVVDELLATGVEIKILTGDNEFVTQKICDDIGLSVKGTMLGTQINSLTDDALRVAVERNTIFARVTPDQKTRIILALKSNNHVVGYMGDGINDAPSLKNADVGISVNSAVDVAKESAAIVLTHKSLRILKEGVIDGRKTFGNTMKYIMMNLSSNFGNMFSVVGAILFLPFLPMLPIQILLNNFIYDVSQVTLPTDNVDDEFVKRPKRWNIKFIKSFMLIFGPVSSLFDFLTFFLMFFVFRLPAGMFQTAWFMESLATQTLVIHVIRTKKTPFLESTASKYLLISTTLCVIIGWILPYTFIGRYFGFEPLSWSIIFILIGIVLFYLILVEIVKKIFYKTHDF